MFLKTSYETSLYDGILMYNYFGSHIIKGVSLHLKKH